MYCLITPTTFDQKVRSLPTFSFYTLRIQKLSLFLVHHQHLPPSPIQSTISPNDHPTLQRYIFFQHANKAALELSQLNKVMPKLSLKSNHSHLMLFHHLSHSLPTTPLLNESYLIKVLPSNLIYVTSWSKPVQSSTISKESTHHFNPMHASIKKWGANGYPGYKVQIHLSDLHFGLGPRISGI